MPSDPRMTQEEARGKRRYHEWERQIRCRRCDAHRNEPLTPAEPHPDDDPCTGWRSPIAELLLAQARAKAAKQGKAE